MPSKLQIQIDGLRRQIADQEAVLGTLREQLARLERRQNPADAAAISGLDLLWKAALPKSRERSSRHRCRLAWHRIPKAQRPPLEVALAALRTWNKSEEWSRDGHQFAPGLHRFIAERLWEDLPEVRDPLAVYRRPKPPPTAPPAGEPATPEDIQAILGQITERAKCPPSPDE